MAVYSLKAACSHCGRFGTVDDVSLICASCGERHVISADEIRQRAEDIALWAGWMGVKGWPDR